MDFGAYVRQARQARLLTFEAIAAETKIKRELWSDLEANDLKRWPKEQIYRRGFLRAYAEVIGLAPEDVLARFAQQFTEQPEPNRTQPAAGETRVFEGKLQKLALPQIRQFSTLAVLPLGLLIGVGALPLQDRKAAETMSGRSSATSVASVVAHVEQSARQLSGVDVPKIAAPVSGVAAETRAVNLQPIPATAIEGTLLVMSNPPDAFITVNDIGRGKTPLKLQYLALGSYTIRVIQAGYQVSQQRVTLDSENPRRTVRVNLRPVS